MEIMRYTGPMEAVGSIIDVGQDGQWDILAESRLAGEAIMLYLRCEGSHPATPDCAAARHSAENFSSDRLPHSGANQYSSKSKSGWQGQVGGGGRRPCRVDSEE
jgi:hypothetical protein